MIQFPPYGNFSNNRIDMKSFYTPVQDGHFEFNSMCEFGDELYAGAVIDIPEDSNYFEGPGYPFGFVICRIENDNARHIVGQYNFQHTMSLVGVLGDHFVLIPRDPRIYYSECRVHFVPRTYDSEYMSFTVPNPHLVKETDTVIRNEFELSSPLILDDRVVLFMKSRNSPMHSHILVAENNGGSFKITPARIGIDGFDVVSSFVQDNQIFAVICSPTPYLIVLDDRMIVRSKIAISEMVNDIGMTAILLDSIKGIRPQRLFSRGTDGVTITGVITTSIMTVDGVKQTDMNIGIHLNPDLIVDNVEILGGMSDNPSTQVNTKVEIVDIFGYGRNTISAVMVTDDDVNTSSMKILAKFMSVPNEAGQLFYEMLSVDVGEFKRVNCCTMFQNKLYIAGNGDEDSMIMSVDCGITSHLCHLGHA